MPHRRADLALAEIGDRSDEPWPGHANEFALFEEEEPGLLHDFLRFIGRESVAFARYRVQQIAHAAMELFDVERLLRRRQILDLGQQVGDRAEDRFGRRRFAHHFRGAATEHFVFQLERGEAGEREDARARADAPDRVEQVQPFRFGVQPQVGNDDGVEGFRHQRFRAEAVESAAALDRFALQQGEQAFYDRFLIIDNQYFSSHRSHLQAYIKAAAMPDLAIT